MRAVGMAGKDGKANKSPLNKALQATQPADAPSGTGLEETTSRWPGFAAKTQQLQTNVGLPLAVQCR